MSNSSIRRVSKTYTWNFEETIKKINENSIDGSLWSYGTYIYEIKNNITTTVYRLPTARSSSSCIPATRAKPKLVRSIRDMEYIAPNIGKSRISILRLFSLSELSRTQIVTKKSIFDIHDSLFLAVRELGDRLSLW